MALSFAATATSSSSLLLSFPRTTASPVPLIRRRFSTTSISASSSSSPSPSDRLLSASVYLFPFLDGARHGRFLAAQIPFLRPLLPLSSILHSSPIPSLVLFLSLYFGVVRNPNTFPRFVRFNAMQAVALDVLLILPDLLDLTFDDRGGVARSLFASLDSTVFLYLLVCLVYGSTCCFAGTIPRLPLVADAAESQVF